MSKVNSDDTVVAELVHDPNTDRYVPQYNVVIPVTKKKVFVPFWNDKLKVVLFELKKFLESEGFGNFQSSTSRLSTPTLFHNDNNVLKLHNPKSVWTWVNDFLESEGVSDDILNLWTEFSEDRLKKTVLNRLDVWSNLEFENTKQLTFFNDTSDTAFVVFDNGVVKITESDIDLLSLDSLGDKGVMWESSVLNHNISITDNDDGKFSEFFNKSMYRPKEVESDTGDWRDDYELTDVSTEELESLRTSYGYLLHRHNTDDKLKMIFFIDEDSHLGKPEGGNGKSLIMESVEHYRKKAYCDGKKFRQGSDSSRFMYSHVELDTGFLFIDDVTPTFDFTDVFNDITGDLTVERKNKDKVIIPKDRKPKMGSTTNYVVAGTGASVERRRHIVEFGSYWNKVNKVGESPSDKQHLGEILFSWDKDSVEWNHFYNFGFRCIQEYLLNGLVETSNKSYMTKSIQLEIEGVDGDGQGTAWLNDWIKTTRLSGRYHIDGISEKDMYSDFTRDNINIIPDVGGVWSEKFFSQAVWIIVELTKGYHYNKHLSNKGNTKSNRRWQKGSVGQQIPWIKITTDFDTQWATSEDGSVKKESSVKDVEIEKMFQKLNPDYK
jgi:hypothetical protein